MAKRFAPLLLAAAVSVVPGAAPAQPAPPAANPASLNARDFSGIWMNDNTLDERLKREGRKRLGPNEEAAPPRPKAPLTSEYQKIFDDEQAAKAKLEEGVANCEWQGMPRVMTYPYPLEILHTPGRITMIFEADSQVRRIFLDRATHLPEDDLDPSYYGDSIARWEGDTLVVDTVGFNTETHVSGDLPHSEDMHIEERWRQVRPGVLEVHMTVTDPKAFTRPITQTITYSRRPDWRIREYSCLENNRDAADAYGKRAGGIVDGGKVQ